MVKLRLLVPLVSIVVLAGWQLGCQSSSTPNSASDAGTTSGDAEGSTTSGEEGPMASHEGHSAMDKMKEGLAELSDADRKSAEKQHMCPVTGKMLGTMGKPIKVHVKDRDVWICCPGCREELLANPDKYLAKLTN